MTNDLTVSVILRDRNRKVHEKPVSFVSSSTVLASDLFYYLSEQLKRRDISEIQLVKTFDFLEGDLFV